MAFAAGAVALAALVPLFPHYFVHWDEVQLRLAVERVDLVWHQPHAPGYYVYVLLARLVRVLGPQSIEPGRIVSALAAAGFAVLVGLRLPAGLARGPRALLLLAALGVVLCTPLVRFFAVSHLTYACEGVAWLGILLLAERRPRGPALWACAFLVGVAGGLRPTLLVWSALLCAGLWWRDRSWIRPRDLAPAALALGVGIAAWLAPMLAETGGLAAYVEATRRIGAGAIWSKSVFVHPAELLGRVPVMLWHAASALVWLPVPFLGARALARGPGAPTADPARAPAGPPILLAGAAIAFAFYALLIYDSAGYAISFVLPLAAWGILACADLALPLRGRRGALPGAALVASLCVGEALFSLSDYSLATLREHDAQLRARFEAVAKRFPPETTLLVTAVEHRSWAFRHVMYYLPGYTTLQLVHDPFFVRSTPEAPYLTAREHRVWATGPDGLDVAQLAPEGARLEHVVFMVPADAARFVGASCTPWLERVETSEGEALRSLRVSPALPVAVRDERLECSPPGRISSAGGR